MTILPILKWIVANRKSLFKAICGLSVGLLVAWCVITGKQNKKLSESLEMALNNIEAYLGIVNDSLLANNVLRLSVELLQNQNDDLLNKIDSIRKKLKIKPSLVNTAATQTQLLLVNGGKGVEGDLTEILKDTIYTDSIKYNKYTSVYYTIGKDTVDISVDIKNTQYLYIYYTKEYKNKKNFLLRLFTLDFKKVERCKYEILNTNDLILTEDVRVVELNDM